MKVSVIITERNLPRLVDYHCMRCTRKLFRINREMAAVWMGELYPAREIPKNMGWIEIKCRGCEMIYSYYVQ